MENYPYAGGGNVVVDACDHCQLIWLDAGELDVITNHVPAAAPRSTYLPPSSVAEDEGLFSLLP
jgi:Zn-finger nucleic acid-binding protein